MRALLTGRHPAVDHEGKQFPYGSCRGKLAGKALKVHGEVISKCGDWDWFKQSLGLVGWQGEGANKRVCWLCRAGMNDANYCYDFSLSAAWRGTPVDEAGFWHDVAQGTQFCSAIWSIPGFSIEHCRPDFMHTCCPGILQYLQGNVMWEPFVSQRGSCHKWQQACCILENIVRSAANSMKVQPPLNSLTLGMFRADAGLKPKRKSKAAEGRSFLPVLRHMLSCYFPLQSLHELLRFQCVDVLHKVYLEMFAWNPDGSSSERLGHVGRQHLALYSELAKTTADDMLWHLYPKHHQFVHAIETARANPKLEWNYAEEDAIRRQCCRCGQRVQPPTHLH